MICKDNLPLNTTEKEGFKYFMQGIEPLYKIPGRKAITSMIDDKYDLLSNIIKKKFLECHLYQLRQIFGLTP